MTKFKRHSNNIASKINGEYVMLNAKEGHYFSLNAVGSRIWEILESPSTKSEINAILLEEFEVDAETCSKEVDDFIQTCVQMGVLEIDEE